MNFDEIVFWRGVDSYLFRISKIIKFTTNFMLELQFNQKSFESEIIQSFDFEAWAYFEKMTFFGNIVKLGVQTDASHWDDSHLGWSQVITYAHLRF